MEMAIIIIGLAFIGSTVAWLLYKERQQSRPYDVYKKRDEKAE